MQYTPAGTGVMEGIKHGADVAQSQAAAGYSDAMANRMNQMLPYDLSKAQFEQEGQRVAGATPGYHEAMAAGQMGTAQQQQYAAKKAMEDYRRRPIEDQQKDKEKIQKLSDAFFDDFAKNILAQGGDRDSAAQMMAQQDPMWADTIKKLQQNPQVWGRFTAENALARLKANSQYLQAQQQAASKNDNTTLVDLMMSAAGGNQQAGAALKLYPQSQPVQTVTEDDFEIVNGKIVRRKTQTKGPVEEAAPAPKTQADKSGFTQDQLNGKAAVAIAESGTKDGTGFYNKIPVEIRGGQIFLVPPKK
jgi:hypothetical protein